MLFGVCNDSRSWFQFSPPAGDCHPEVHKVPSGQGGSVVGATEECCRDNKALLSGQQNFDTANIFLRFLVSALQK
jgi:hypothetical protein